MMDMNVLNELPGKLRDGDDLAWLQTQYDTGALADVGAQVTPEEWATVGTALHAGDLETVRTVLKDAQIEGVGPVVVAKRNNRPWIIAGIVLALLAVVGVVIWLVTKDDGGTTENIPTTLANNPDYSTLSGLLGDSTLDELLAGDGPFTMFAANNDAFAAMPADQLLGIKGNPTALKQLLNYSIVAQKASLSTDDLVAGALPTLEGSPVAITKDGSNTKINTATIIDPNIAASNGTIQGIDKVLIPPDLELTAAPTQNIVDSLQANPDFSTYVGLLKTAGLTATLGETGPYTVFAPNNAAFAAVPKDVFDQVVADQAQLRAVLGYTIVLGSYPDDQLKTGQLPTTQGDPITVAVSGSTITVDNATVVPPQTLATNGVIHALDKVIAPPGTDVTPKPTEDIVGVVAGNPDYSTLSQLLTSSGPDITAFRNRAVHLVRAEQRGVRSAPCGPTAELAGKPEPHAQGAGLSDRPRRLPDRVVEVGFADDGRRRLGDDLGAGNDRQGQQRNRRAGELARHQRRRSRHRSAARPARHQHRAAAGDDDCSGDHAGTVDDRCARHHLRSGHHCGAGNHGGTGNHHAGYDDNRPTDHRSRVTAEPLRGVERQPGVLAVSAAGRRCRPPGAACLIPLMQSRSSRRRTARSGPTRRHSRRTSRNSWECRLPTSPPLLAITRLMPC